MTVREFADACHVSTATVTRFCHSLDLSGFSELKYEVKKYLEQQDITQKEKEHSFDFQNFLLQTQTVQFRQKMALAVQLIQRSHLVVLFGIGGSGVMAEYGQRYFSNVGITAYSFKDPYLPTHLKTVANTVYILLSVSGETPLSIEKALKAKQQQSKVIVITSNERSTLGRLADCTLHYGIVRQTSPRYQSYVDIISHIQILSIIEEL